MGVDLVEGRDLICRDDVCYVRTTAGEERVDVIYRRIDDDFLDPVQFRPDSRARLRRAGPRRPGRERHHRRTRSATASPTTSSSTRYVPDLIEYYLGEPPLLRNVDTYRLEDDEVRALVLDRLDQMVREAGRRVRRLRAGVRARAPPTRSSRRPAATIDAESPRLHRPADRHALDGADARRRSAATPPPRPAARSR